VDVCSIFLIYHISDYLCELSIGKIIHTAVTTQQDWRTQQIKHHTGPENACAAEKFLMMGTMVSETCRTE